MLHINLYPSGNLRCFGCDFSKGHFVCPCFISKVLPSIFGSNLLFPIPISLPAALAYSLPSALRVAKGSFPGCLGSAQRLWTRDIYHVGGNNGTMEGVLSASPPLFRWLLSDLTDTLQELPTLHSGCFLSFSLFHVPTGLEPALFVSAFLSLPSHSFLVSRPFSFSPSRPSYR